MRVELRTIQRQQCCRGVVGTLGLALAVLGAVGIALHTKNGLRCGLSCGAVVVGGSTALWSLYGRRTSATAAALDREEAAYQARVLAVGEGEASRDLREAAQRMRGLYGPRLAFRDDNEASRVANQANARCALLRDMATQQQRAVEVRTAVGLATLVLMAEMLEMPEEKPVGEEAQATEARRAVREEMQVLARVLEDRSWQSSPVLVYRMRTHACTICLIRVTRTQLQDRNYGQLLASWSGDFPSNVFCHGAIQQATQIAGPKLNMAPLMRDWAAHLPEGMARREVLRLAEAHGSAH
jgi:hypothetical protein